MLNTPSSAASYVRKHPDTGIVPLDCVLPSESIAFVLPDTTYSVPTGHTTPSPVVCAVSPLAVVVAAAIAAASHSAFTVVSSPVEPESGSITAGTTSAFTVESFTVIPDIMFCILSVQLLTESHVVPWNTMSLQYCILFHVLSVFLSTAFFA